MGLFSGLKQAITGITSSTAGSVIDSLANGISQFVDTPEKKLEYEKWKSQAALDLQKQLDDHNEKMGALYEQSANDYLKDAQNAREMQETALKGDDKVSKRFIYYLAGILLLLVFAFDACLFFVDFPDKNRDMVNQVCGVLNSGALIMVLSFFFGSSKGSADKQILIEKMISKDQQGGQ